jgi:uncharacterized membrane protein
MSSAWRNDDVYSPAGRNRDLGRATHLVYALYAAALVTGLPFFIGVIIAYLVRGRAGGTMYDSHLGWLITTFWVLLVLGFFFGLFSTFLTLWIGMPFLGLLWLWTLYRVVRGWLALAGGSRVP